MNVLLKTLTFLCVIAAVCPGTGCGNRQVPPPRAEKGVLDLRAHDFKRGGPVHLSGQWAFYWQSFRVTLPDGKGDASPVFAKVPGNWNDVVVKGEKIGGNGYGTFELTLLLPQKIPPLSLRLLSIGTSYVLFADGQKIASAGIPGTDAASTSPSFTPRVCRIDPGPDRVVKLCIQVANFHESHGGLWDALVLGSDGDIRKAMEERRYLEFVIFGAIFFMGLYHLGLYLLKPGVTAPLYFSMICFLIATRIMYTQERYILEFFPNLNWTLFHKIEYLTFSVTVGVFVAFIRVMFPLEFNRTFYIVSVAVSLFYSLMIIITPPLVYSALVNIFQVITLVICSYILYVHGKAIGNKRNGSVVMTFGFFILFMMVINDILHQNQMIQTGFFVPVGVFVFVFSQAIVILLRYSKAFDAIEMLKEAAETANDAKTQFIANMSHELRTPLNGVIGMTELIRGTTLSENQREYLDIIRSSSSLLLTIVNDILDLSKLESGQFYIENESFNLVETVEAVHSMLRDRATSKGLDFTCRIDPAIVPMVSGDGDRLKQILLNLTGNALKFTEKGAVSIHLEPVEKTDTRQTLMFRICDTGIGIEPETMERLFMPFSQADVSMSRKYGGTGLGLAISKQLAERMGGTISVESRPGDGSEFRLVLPFPIRPEEKAARPPEEGSQTPQATHPSSHILIVEDNPANRRFAEILVKKFGHSSESVCDGKEAVDLLCSKTFDLILMDIQMPVMDGLEAARIIRDPASDILIHDVPIIAMTAHAMKGDMEKCFAAGMDAYLTKPIKPKNLEESIGQQLARNSNRAS